MGMRERAAERRRRMEIHRARGFDDAERWDLAYWQRRTPQERLSALVAIHRDIEKVRAGKKSP
ncbi:MAG: hypothetical protein GF344_00780 [Chitinivibrionales bacterium]|nr:hypothetical protein [Chitinivibrionales bacterium]